MNIDQLKKLIALANNNPNDHEANAAARKVCKLIAENNFEVLNNSTPINNMSSNFQGFGARPQGRNSYDDILEYIRRTQQQYGTPYQSSYYQQKPKLEKCQECNQERDDIEERTQFGKKLCPFCFEHLKFKNKTTLGFKFDYQTNEYTCNKCQTIISSHSFIFLGFQRKIKCPRCGNI